MNSWNLRRTSLSLRERDIYIRKKSIVRRPHSAPPSRDTGPRVNENIICSEVRLIGSDGDNVGVVSPEKALELSEEVGLDLVEISPNAAPPVCKIMDYGKYKYEQQKKESEARKNQKIIEVKEIKFRPGTDTHDYNFKIKNAKKFIIKGDKVKFTVKFKGREMQHTELGKELMNKIIEETKDIAKVESRPKFEGRQMIMIIQPI